ncbi:MULTISPECIES: HD domain-containing phosphohydrolase [unclassified Clostridium]|uniref:HD-GYP domain-containing protein n=1 Tax=unclassified Clostridium TaxID=2614128 RepID=UPI0013F13D48|nr:MULTISPECIES: HD domain-containing phosphohydrolase [unclassified Clostridium]NFG61157.1 HD domain-containing protein [Clostridium botulinum]NFQ08903.1 HD domain-containing protein [Clostridium botulinum]
MECIFNNHELICHDLIESIVFALDAKDSYTAKHSMRVGDMACEVCKFLNLSTEDREIIHIAGHVHDIGKIGIPDNILNKKSKLSEEEWNVIKQHPAIGAKILSSSKKLAKISEIILYHHERVDGNGYPKGLKENQIPLGARIISICDSIDAMLSKRAYRNSLKLSACKLEIEKNIGIMYDEKIAKCVLNNWDSLNKSIKR